MTPKEIVRKFYATDFIKDTSVLDRFFHPEVSLMWNNSEGLTVLKFEDLKQFFGDIRKAYIELRVEISHLLSQRNFVTVRHKYYVRTVENPEEEIGIAHFMVIWELQDDKIINGYQISQPTSVNESEKAYTAIKY